MADPVKTGIKAVVAVGLTVATGGTALAAFVAAGSTLVFDYYANYERKRQLKKLRESALDISSRARVLRQPVTTANMIYGQQKVGGSMVFAQTTNNDEDLHTVTVVANHEIESFDAFFINEEHVPLDGDPNTGLRTAVMGNRYRNKFFVRGHLGDDNQVADPDLIRENSNIDANFRLRGMAYFYCKLVYDEETYPRGNPLINCVVKGKKVRDIRSTSRTKVFSSNPSLILWDFFTDPILGLGMADDEVDMPSFISAANIADTRIGLNPNASFSNYTQVYELDGNKITSSVAPINNGDFIRLSRPGRAGVSGIARTDGVGGIEILDSAGAVQTLPAQTPTLVLRRQQEYQYSVNGVFSSSQLPIDIISDIASAQAASITYTGATVKIIPDIVDPPSEGTITEDDLIATNTIIPKRTRNERFNQVVGVFQSPINNWLPTDFAPEPQGTNMGAVEDKETIVRDLALDLTISPSMAQRLARAYLTDARREEIINITVPAYGFKYEPGSAVTLNLPNYGINEKYIVENMEFSNVQGASGITDIINMTLRDAVVSRVWTAITDERNVVTDVTANLPNPFSFVHAPSTLTLASGDANTIVNTSGNVSTFIKATWTITDGASFANQFEIQIKQSSATAWDSVIVPGSSRTHQLGPVIDKQLYDVRIRSISSLGIKSAWLLEERHMVIGKTAPPPNVISFDVMTDPSGARVFTADESNWPNDILGIQLRAIEHRTGVAPDYDTMGNVGDVRRSLPYTFNTLRQGKYDFGAKLVDTSGNVSVTPTYITRTLGKQNLGESFFIYSAAGEDWAGTSPAETIKIESRTGGVNWLAYQGNLGWSLPGDFEGPAGGSWLNREYLPGIIYFTSEVIDLGAVTNFFVDTDVEFEGFLQRANLKVAHVVNGNNLVGGETLDIRNGPPTRPLAGRYLQLEIWVSHISQPVSSRINALLEEVRLELFAGTVDIDYDINTANTQPVPGYTRTGVGAFTLEHFSAASITSASAAVVGIPTAGGADKIRRISLNAEPGSTNPKASFAIFNSSNQPVEGEVEVELRGPRRSP